jgi:hypothetical protein
MVILEIYVITVFLDMMPCNLVGMDILQEPAAFIFRAERNGIIILTL